MKIWWKGGGGLHDSMFVLIVVITTAPLHLIKPKPEPTFCAGSNHACGMLQIRHHHYYYHHHHVLQCFKLLAYLSFACNMKQCSENETSNPLRTQTKLILVLLLILPAFKDNLTYHDLR